MSRTLVKIIAVDVAALAVVAALVVFPANFTTLLAGALIVAAWIVIPAAIVWWVAYDWREILRALLVGEAVQVFLRLRRNRIL